MGIILFLVDTSSSMNQKTYLGTTYLDIAKGAIDTFMKYRARDPASGADHYMLVSFEDPPTAIKVGWENHGSFMTELKNLQAVGLSTLSQSLKESLDLLNVNRLHTGIDHYGQGRNPFFLEPAVIIALTDGGKFNKNSQTGEIEEELLFLRNSSAEGSELTKEPFRWDQRLFVVLLQLPGLNGTTPYNNGDDQANSSYCSLSSLCEYTGGKCYTGSNMKSLSQCMESISQKLHPGVVLNFRKIETTDSAQQQLGKSKERVGNGKKDEMEEGNNTWCNTRKMIYVRPNPKTNIPSGHWPIPESFWPDPSLPNLLSRDVHPIVWFDAVDIKPKLLESFAFDKYELEPSPLTQYILEKRDPNTCWQVYISDCGKERGISSPFGYLKSSSSGSFVNLFVMPFNYTRLLPLIEELQRLHLRPSSKWRSEFADYISTIPSYYAQPLRKALQLMGAHPSLVPDSFDGQMGYSITNYLRKLKKQAKIEASRLSTQIQRNRIKTENNTKKSSGIVDLGDGSSIAIGSPNEEGLTSQSYRNPFDIPRRSLLSQVARMRANFMYSSVNAPHLIEEVTKHQVPIGQMGNYQKHLKKINPLREIDTGDVRTQLFGNPFKLEKTTDKRSEDYGNIADEMMIERLKRPGSPRSSRKHRLRSPSPAPTPPQITPQTTPTSDAARTSKDSTNVSLPRPETENGSGSFPSVGPTTPVVAMETDNVEIVEIDSSTQQQKIDLVVKGDVELVPDPLEGTDKDLIISDPVLIQVDSNSHGEKPLSKTSTEQNNSQHKNDSYKQLADSVLTTNRKRTPSPTSFGFPPSKRSNKDSALKVPNIENVSKANNKSPSPSPMLAPIRSSGLLSSASHVLNEEFKRKQTTENLKIKQLIAKEIRKHSKNYDPIFQHLDNIQGTVDTKKAFVSDIIKEAERFRKKQLVALLHDWILGLSLSKSEKPRGSSKLANKFQTTNR